MKMTRRGFLQFAGRALLGAGATAAAGGYYVTQVEPEKTVIERVQIPVPRLPAALDGLRIVQLSDFHLYPFTQIGQIEQAIDLANGLKPDLVLLTGDYVQARSRAIFELAPALARLNPRYGLFAVLGNHDRRSNIRMIAQAMGENRLPVLINQGVRLHIGGAPLYVAGLDDAWRGRPDLGAALDGAHSDDTVVLLVHEPDFADEFSQDGRVTLQLSGHSHGGQVRIPGVGAPVLPNYGQKYDAGRYRVGDMWLYTNRGLGVISPPVRFNCPPEVTELTLVAEPIPGPASRAG